MTDEYIVNEKRNKAKDKQKSRKGYPYRKNYKKGKDLNNLENTKEYGKD